MFEEDGVCTVRFASKRRSMKAMLKLWPTGVQSGKLLLDICSLYCSAQALLQRYSPTAHTSNLYFSSEVCANC